MNLNSVYCRLPRTNFGWLLWFILLSAASLFFLPYYIEDSLLCTEYVFGVFVVNAMVLMLTKLCANLLSSMQPDLLRKRESALSNKRAIKCEILKKIKNDQSIANDEPDDVENSKVLNDEKMHKNKNFIMKIITDCNKDDYLFQMVMGACAFTGLILVMLVIYAVTVDKSGGVCMLVLVAPAVNVLYFCQKIKNHQSEKEKLAAVQPEAELTVNTLDNTNLKPQDNSICNLTSRSVLNAEIKKIYENEQKRQQEIQGKLMLEKEEKIKKQNEAELKLKQDEQVKLSALKRLETLSKREENILTIRNKLKTGPNLNGSKEPKRRLNLVPIKEQHALAIQERIQSIAERPLRTLRSFGLDEFMSYELPPYNQNKLNEMVEILERFNIPELEIYGSYPVFLASLRLDIPSEQVRRPGDLDLRFEMNVEDVVKSSMLVRDLLNLGYRLKAYALEDIDIIALQNFINDKKRCGGYLNLSFSEPKDLEAYEIELTMTFKDIYQYNYNPFGLLRHCIVIRNKECFFDDDNQKLKKQLAVDILENRFSVSLTKIMDPTHYNVFNFFPRLLRNKKEWGSYYDMSENDVFAILNNVQLILNFFSVRFCLHMQKECYLELVGIITQNLFSAPEAENITKGFLLALLQAVNVESKILREEDLFSSQQMPVDVDIINQKIHQDFSTLLCVATGDQEYTRKVLRKFYNCLMKTLIHHYDDSIRQQFLLDRQQDKTSILFNAFQKPLCFKYEVKVTPKIAPRIQAELNNSPNNALELAV